MAKPFYKLTYFDLRGRGEVARIIFSLAGQEYEDIRVHFQEWPTVKPTTPQGFLPVLETAEGKMSQCVAIDTYLAEKFGFMPDTAYEKGQSISIMQTLNEMVSKLSSNLYMSIVYKAMPIPDDIEEKKKTGTEDIKKCLEFIEGLAKPGAKLIFGDKLTVADIFLFTIMETQLQVLPEMTVDNKWFLKVFANIKADPGIIKHIEGRKESMIGV